MIIAAFLNHLPDGQRKTTWEADKSLLQPLINSCKSKAFPIVILNNCFDEDEMFKGCEPVKDMLPNMARWICIREYLENLEVKPEWFFCVDSTDVELLNIPSIETGYVYVGDEVGMKVGNEWMRRYQRCHVRIKDYDEVIEKNKAQPLLNCGIVGGDYKTAYQFIKELSGLHKLHSRYITLEGAGSTDMATFNYLCYKKWIAKIKHGSFINTQFKKYEYTNAWFRHK
jgi:hypothetical protein